MTKKQIEKEALRNIAWAALEGFRRDHQGAQGIISDDLFDRGLDNRKDAEAIIEFTIATLRKFGLDDNEQLLEIRKDEYEELEGVEWGTECPRCGAKYFEDPSCGKTIHLSLPHRPKEG